MKNYKDLLNELPSKTAVFAVGNFNPPNVGHELEIKVVRKLAKQRKADHFIFVSSVQDAKKNPLDISKKIQYLELLFPNTKFIPKEMTEAIHALKKYKSIVAVTSPDYVNEFKKNLKKYGFENVEVVSAGTKCPDSDDKLIKLASKGNYQSFKTGLPTTIRDLDAKRLMNDVRVGLDLEPIKEQINLVKDNLREQYFRGEIFNEGDIVESNNTVYKIIKRGSNHLLLQTEEGLKISKWIQDVQLTERQFMLKQLQEADSTSATGQSNTTMKKAQADNQKAQLAAKQANEKMALAQKQERERDTLKTEAVESPVVDKNSKYNIAKSVMSLKDFRKSLGQVKQEDNEEEKCIADKIEDEMEGHSHIAPSIDTLRRMKIKHHLGEGSYAHGFASPHGGLHQNKREDDEYHNEPKPAFKAKKLMDRPHTVHIDNKPWKEFSNGHQAHAAAKTLQGKGKNAVAIARFKEETEYVDIQEFGDWSEEDFEKLVEQELDAWTDDDMLELYEDDELAIIDDETGEEIEAVEEEAGLDNPVLMEVLSRIERIRAKARMRRTKTKRVRAEKIALKRFSTPQVANKRARRMAISAMKKRLLRGQNPQKVSIGQKERVERFIQQRRKVVDRLSARMVSRVKQVEKARMAHKRYTKPNNGVSF